MTLKEFVSRYGTDGTTLMISELLDRVPDSRSGPVEARSNDNLKDLVERRARDLQEMLRTEQKRFYCT